MKFQFRTLIGEAELETAFLVLRELRKNLSFEDFLKLYRQARNLNGYRLIVAHGIDGVSESPVIGVMGYRILFDFVHGKHLYIDDLVTAEEYRSQGLGAAFLKHARTLAASASCTILRLSTGIENERGKAFYERNGLSMRAVVYKNQLGKF